MSLVYVQCTLYPREDGIAEWWRAPNQGTTTLISEAHPYDRNDPEIASVIADGLCRARAIGGVPIRSIMEGKVALADLLVADERNAIMPASPESIAAKIASDYFGSGPPNRYALKRAIVAAIQAERERK